MVFIPAKPDEDAVPIEELRANQPPADPKIEGTHGIDEQPKKASR